MEKTTERPAPRVGRPKISNQGDIQRAAMRLFNAHGFEEVTMDEIAETAGISRRTLFRYFATKHDLVWGDFEANLIHMRQLLEEYSVDAPLREAVRHAVIEFNRVPRSEIVVHRQRMRMILDVPGLQAHSTLKYAAWRKVISDFLTDRGVAARASWYPELIAHLCLAASLSAYETWLSTPRSDLSALLEDAYAVLTVGLDVDLEPPAEIWGSARDKKSRNAAH